MASNGTTQGESSNLVDFYFVLSFLVGYKKADAGGGLTAMPAMSTLKSNRTRAKNALAREEADANELLQREWASSTEQEIVRFCLSIGKVLLNLETKLSRLEVANDRLADAYDTARR